MLNIVTSPDDRVRDWAESGAVALTGWPTGPPIIPPGSAASVARTLAMRVTASAAISGRHVDLDGAKLLSERAAFTGSTRQGAISVGGGCRLLRAVDGWVAVSCVRPDDPILLGAVIEAEIDADNPWPALIDWLARHTFDEFAERSELIGVAAAPVRLPAVPSDHPLPTHARSVEGLLVINLGSLWAGPLCAHLLGAAGARVVKVEARQRPDGARNGNRRFYDLLNGGHESVCLDLSGSVGRGVLAALVDAADVVIESSRPRALAGFGIDAEAAAAADTTWVSITAAGRSSGRIGFGDDVAAGAGLVAPARGGPMFVGDAIADPLTGLMAAALVCSENSRGQLIDLSMADVVASTLGLRGDFAPAVRAASGRWIADGVEGLVEIAEPVAREVHSRAANLGQDTLGVLASLGIATAGVE